MGQFEARRLFYKKRDNWTSEEQTTQWDRKGRGADNAEGQTSQRDINTACNSNSYSTSCVVHMSDLN